MVAPRCLRRLAVDSDTKETETFYAHLAPSYVADTIRVPFPTLNIVEKTSVTAIRRQRT
jgi:hypothetical protein